MTGEQQPPRHSIKEEPKFCRRRACHEHFYGETIEAARQPCLDHGRREHPEWGPEVCYYPD